MLIDESSKFARLSTTVAGIDHFQPIYILIWQRIKLLEEQIVKMKSKYYYFNGKIIKNKESLSLEILDQKNNLSGIIENLEQLVQMEQLTIPQDIVEIINNLDEFITNNLMAYIKGIINEVNFIILPQYFKEYLDLQLPNWIISALQAIKFQENIHYVISEGQIKPVDFKNTGIIQNSTYWGNGLHQFLQIKHNLKVTSETFLTNFLSNVGYILNGYLFLQLNKIIIYYNFKLYFKKYNNKRLFGLTGTLGSQKAQEMLTQIYGVNLVFIPQNNHKLFQELPLVVVNDEEWLYEIIKSARNECNNNRGVLIICETISDARKIHKKLLMEYCSSKIKLYDQNNKFLEKQIEIINSGQIFVATNLAGRGTDIKTNKIEEYGGLHVILTFMPANKRIEEQAFGRTARLANAGTGQMILNEQHFKNLNYDQKDYSQLKLKRDEVEANRLKEYMKNDLEEIKLKEMYFEKFCILLNQQRVNIKTQKQSTQLERHFTILNIEEKWALFQLQQQGKQDNIDVKFQEFEVYIKELCDKKEIIHSILDIIYQFDYYYIIQSQLKKQTLQNTKNALDDIIKVDGDQLTSVYQELAYLYLKKDICDKNIALNNFQKAIDLLDKELVQWQSLHMSLLKQSKNFENSDLHKQIQQKLYIIVTCVNTIQENMKVIKKSQRLIDIVVEQTSPENKISIMYLGLEKKNAISQCSSLGQNEVQLIFNDLSYHQDYIDQDSAIKTIEQICEINQPFDNQITIQLNEILASKLNLLFYDKDISIELDKNTALKQLNKYIKNESSVILIIPQENSKSTSIYEAIQIVEQMSNDINIDIIFMNKELKQWFNNIKNNRIDIELIDLDKEKVKKELKIINSEQINLVITSDIEDICKIIDLPCLQKVKYLKKQLHVLYQRKEAKSIFQNIQDKFSIQTISISNINKQDIENIIDICKDKAKFNLQFNNLDIRCYIEGNQLINARFRVQNIQWSKELIKQLRKFQLEFQLIFNNLTTNQTFNFIEKADIQQQDVEIYNKKKLKELNLQRNIDVSQEYWNFEARGIKDIITLSENKCIPVYNMIILGTVAFSQLIVGGILVATGLGGIIGNIILQEGVSDIISLITSCYKREFSWSDYFYTK